MTNDKYRIEAEGNSWNICERRVAGDKAKEPGKVTYVAFNFFGSLEQAAKGLLQIIAHENTGDATECEAILVAIRDAEKTVVAVVRDVSLSCALCRACHDEIENNWNEAVNEGFMISKHIGANE